MTEQYMELVRLVEKPSESEDRKLDGKNIRCDVPRNSAGRKKWIRLGDEKTALEEWTRILVRNPRTIYAIDWNARPLTTKKNGKPTLAPWNRWRRDFAPSLGHDRVIGT